MRHVSLTCKHHPELRWTCKSIAFTPGRGYNNARHIFFAGKFADECSCSPQDMILAPNDPWGALSEIEQAKAIKKDCAGC